MTAGSALFVDDDAITHWIMSDVLTDAGYDVASACRGGEAIRMIGRDPEFDLLICDLDLPDISGADLGQIWRHAAPGKPVIYTGAAHNPALGRLEPHETFLAKPFSPAMLLAAIDAAFQDAILRPASPRTQSRPCYVN